MVPEAELAPGLIEGLLGGYCWYYLRQAEGRYRAGMPT